MSPHLVHVLGVRAPIPVSGPPGERMARVAEAQRGRISSRQLAAAGISRSTISRMVARGQLHREHRGVYAVGHRPATPLGRETAALLACAPGTLLASHSAGVLWEMIAPRAGLPIDLLIHGRETAHPVGTLVHRTRSLLPEDARVHRDLPVTSPARTLLDLADILTPRAVERALDEALVQRLVSRTKLAERLARAPGRRGAKVLRDLLDAQRGPTLTRSEAEERFYSLIRRAELPLPLVNAHVHGFEVDFYWPAERVAVEIDGFRFHGTRSAFERDRRKGAVLTAQGIAVLRPTWRQIVGEPIALVATVALTLGRAAQA